MLDTNECAILCDENIYLSFFFLYCKSNYPYVEKDSIGNSFGEKEKAPVNMEAENDLEAYTGAYKNFLIAKRFSMDSSEVGRLTASVPKNFKLLNRKQENISYEIELKSKDSIERYLDETFEGRETNIYGSIQRAKGMNIITAGEDCPAKLLSAQPVYRETSNFNDIRLVWKNVSKKTISTIKFKWSGLNALDKPADMGEYMGTLLPGEGNGISEDRLQE